MRATVFGAALAATLVVGLPGTVLAGGGNSSGGSGLSPYAAESGNDRSAGVNNGNYRNPRTDPYIRAYGSRYQNRPSYRGYYGYPY